MYSVTEIHKINIAMVAEDNYYATTEEIILAVCKDLPDALEALGMDEVTRTVMDTLKALEG